MRYFYGGAGPRAKLWVIPDGYHVQGFAQHPAEYTAHLLALFAPALGVSP